MTHHPSDPSNQSKGGLSPTRLNVAAGLAPAEAISAEACPRRGDPRCGDPRCGKLYGNLANGNRSEVARLREQIEVEYEAARQALYGLAQGTARHEIISAHMANAQQYGQQLIEQIGPDEALPIIVQAMDEGQSRLNTKEG